MADENTDRKMEFIIEQQAQFAANIGQLEEIVVSFARATRDRFEATDHRINGADERISALIDAQLRLEENLSKTEENVKKTDEALRNLIAVVDRYFSEGRNGNPG